MPTQTLRPRGSEAAVLVGASKDLVLVLRLSVSGDVAAVRRSEGASIDRTGEGGL